MELSDHLRDPVSAALIGAGLTAAYIHLKAYQSLPEQRG